MTQSAVRLSICIPTHDGRGAVLKEAIDSVLSQITPEIRPCIEICVSDNASEDGTRALLAGYSREHPGLFHYSRNPENLGFTRNLMRVVAQAGGDHCWLLSSDDTMAPQGLARVLDRLAEYPGLAGMTCSTEGFNRDMTELLPLGGEWHPSLMPENPSQMHVYTSPAEIFRQCGSVQGYTSAQIFDRRLWRECLAEMGEEQFNSFAYFPYLFLFGRMVKKKPLWIWLPEKLIRSRSENDYLSEHLGFNALKYQRLTMEEVSRVWGELFGRQSATYHSLMRDNYVNFWSGFPMVRFKVFYHCTPAEEFLSVLWFTRRLYFLPSFWAFSLPALLTPSPLARAAWATARRLKVFVALKALKRHFFPASGASAT